MEDTCETYRVKRNIRLPILLEQLYQFYCSQTFTDVTLACDGNFVKCHKLILSVCSSYLEKLLTEAEAESPHPIIILVGIKLTEIKQLLEYMYKGEVILSAQEFPGFLKAAEALFVKGIGVEVEQDEQKQAPEPIVPPPVQFPLQFPFNLLFPFSSCPSPYQSMPLNSHNVLNNLPTSPNEIIQPKNIRHPSSIPLPPIFQTLPQGKSRKTKKAKTNGCTPPAKKHRCSPNVPVDARSNLPSSVCPPGGSVDIKEFISTFPDSRLSKVEKQKPDPSQETKSQLDFKSFEQFPEMLAAGTDGSPESGEKVEKTTGNTTPRTPDSGKSCDGSISHLSSSEQRKYKQYTNADMMLALDCVRQGKLSCLLAARTFRVPSRTLYDRVKRLGIKTDLHTPKQKLLSSPSAYDDAWNSEDAEEGNQHVLENVGSNGSAGETIVKEKYT